MVVRAFTFCWLIEYVKELFSYVIMLMLRGEVTPFVLDRHVTLFQKKYVW